MIKGLSGQKKISYLVTLAAAGILVLVAYYSLSPIVQTKAAAPEMAAAKKPSSSLKSKQNYLKIGQWHLFGKEQRADANSAKTITRDAPETRLALDLLGIFFDSASNDSLAIIAERGKSHKPYRIGDKLPGKAEVYAIETEQVIILRNGRQESLRLKREKSPVDDTSSDIVLDENKTSAAQIAKRSLKKIN